MAERTRVFVEAIPLVEDRPSGVAHALVGLLVALMQEPKFLKNYEIVFVAPKRALHKLDKWVGLEQCTRQAMPTKMRIINLLLKLHILPPLDLFFGKGIYLFGNYKNWPVSRKSISYTYLHDMAFALFPETLPPPLRKTLNTTMGAFIKRSTYIITVSESSRKEIIDYYNLPQDKVILLYNGVDTSIYHKRLPSEIKTAKQKIGVTKPYFIYVGSIEPRKNLARLIIAFRDLPKTHSLVLIGGSGWLNDDVAKAVKDALHDGYSIIQPKQFIGDVDVAALMSGAVALVHPALHEGFGMPPAEALAIGTPVVASDIPSLREVLADSGKYFDLYDSKSIASAMKRVLLTPKQDKTRSAKQGILRVQRFAWDISAQQLMTSLDKYRKQS